MAYAYIVRCPCGGKCAAVMDDGSMECSLEVARMIRGNRHPERVTVDECNAIPWCRPDCEHLADRRAARGQR